MSSNECQEINGSDPIKERRFRLVRVSCELIIALLNAHRGENKFFAIPVLPGLPEDYVVVSVNASWERHAVELIVASRKFEPCEVGCCPEEMRGAVLFFESCELALVLRESETKTGGGA